MPKIPHPPRRFARDLILVLAALFESYINPFVIMLTVPLAIIGVTVGLLAFGQPVVAPLGVDVEMVGREVEPGADHRREPAGAGEPERRRLHHEDFRGRVVDRVVYEELTAAAGGADGLAFPAYRAPAARLET